MIESFGTGYYKITRVKKFNYKFGVGSTCRQVVEEMMQKITILDKYINTESKSTNENVKYIIWDLRNFNLMIVWELFGEY